MKSPSAVVWISLGLLLVGGAYPPPAADLRPGRTVVAKPSAEGESVSLTGHIRAQTEESLAFRIDGRMIARKVDVGVAVKPGDLIAELDPLCVPRRPRLPRRSPPFTKLLTTWTGSGRWLARVGPLGSNSMPLRRRFSTPKPKLIQTRHSCTRLKINLAIQS